MTEPIATDDATAGSEMHGTAPASGGDRIAHTEAKVIGTSPIERSGLDEVDAELLTINMGPHHPATHGVLRLLVSLEGEIVRDLNQKERTTFLLAEQNTSMALRYADYGYILENGRVVMDGEAQALRDNEDVREFYLGMGGTDRKSFRDVKSYKRRKRWLA